MNTKTLLFSHFERGIPCVGMTGEILLSITVIVGVQPKYRYQPRPFILLQGGIPCLGTRRLKQRRQVGVS